MVLVIPPGDAPVLGAATPREAEEAPALVRLHRGRRVRELPNGAARAADAHERDGGGTDHDDRDREQDPPGYPRHAKRRGRDPSGGERQPGATAVREIERRREHEDRGGYERSS